MALYESEKSGISPLMVIPITTQGIEEDIRQEEVTDQYKGKRTQAEALQMKKLDPRRPPRNWYNLKEIIATFVALLWVFFGDMRPLNDQVLKLWRVLNYPYLKAVK